MKRRREKLKVKISTKVIFFFIAVVLVQGILSQIGMYLMIYQSNISSYESQLRITMEGIESYIEQSEDELNDKVGLLCGQKNIIEYTDFRLKNLLNRELILFNQALGLNGIFVFIDGGTLLTADAEEIKDSVLIYKIKEAHKKGLQSFLYNNGTKTHLWSLGQIVRENEVIGMIGARIAVDKNYINTLEKNTNSAALFQIKSGALYSDKIESETWEQLSVNAKGMEQQDVKIFGDYLLGVMSLSSFEAIDGRLLCVLDIKELKHSIQDFNKFAAVLAVMVVSVALITSILFYRKAFLRPYNILQEGVIRIGNGDFSYPIEQTSGDEFGDLVQAVNRMRVNLLNRERELTALANYNELILNNVRSGIITVGHDGRINTCNAVASNMVHIDGYKELPLELDMAGLPQPVKDLIRRGLNEREYVNLQECRLTYDGMEEILLVSISPFSAGTGEEIGIIAVIADVTKVRKLEEQLQISHRLAAIGEMVAGVAHQLRNPLGIMKVSAEILRDNFCDEIENNKEQYTQLTRLLVSEIDSLNYIIHNFLDFAKPLHMESAEYDIREIIESVVYLVQPEQFPDINLKVHIDEGLPLLKLDKNLIEQAVRNLVQNAFEATPSGDIELLVRNNDSGIKIIVKDSGIGMDESTENNIFNPFFSLKNSGTGLGLSIVHRIIQEHNGTIHVESSPGKGSVFTIEL